MGFIMPILPSGRRIEFSLDRFHAMLDQLDPASARALAESLNDPDDLLYVLDAVHFSLADGQAYFAGYFAADWESQAADWTTADRQALRAWLYSPAAYAGRVDAVRYIRTLLLESGDRCRPYPYLIHGTRRSTPAVMTSRWLQ
jgi:hypothetical protein